MVGPGERGDLLEDDRLCAFSTGSPCYLHVARGGLVEVGRERGGEGSGACGQGEGELQGSRDIDGAGGGEIGLEVATAGAEFGV